MFLLLLALQAAGPATVPAADDPVVCVREQSDVGTHMRPKKTCMKKSEWDYIERNTKQKLQQINDRGNNPGMADGHAPPR
jgi:hypothetical protein